MADQYEVFANRPVQGGDALIASWRRASGRLTAWSALGRGHQR